MYRDTISVINLTPESLAWQLAEKLLPLPASYLEPKPKA